MSVYAVSPLGSTRYGDRVFHWGERTFVMGVINMTPDSFSGDGLGDDVEGAVALARRMEAEGADLIDVGGESTRPGSTPVSTEEEMGRVIPVVERLHSFLGIPISIDTYKGEVARAAVAAGAVIINDVWGLKKDEAVAWVAAEHDVPLILMHNQEGTQYGDLVPEVIGSLRASMDKALAAGVSWDNIIIDPGIGFGKTWEHNLVLLRRLAELKALGRPILLGTSRKSVIGKVLDLPVDQRLEGTAATVALGIANGADIVRVHEVQEMVRVCRMSDAIVRGRW